MPVFCSAAIYLPILDSDEPLMTSYISPVVETFTDICSYPIHAPDQLFSPPFVPLRSDDGVLVPMGPATDAPEKDRAYLMYNEYIVYDVAQVRMRYALRVQFAFK